VHFALDNHDSTRLFNQKVDFFADFVAMKVAKREFPLRQLPPGCDAEKTVRL
jgi:hypothetical protein